VGMRRRTDRQMDTQTAVANIHFASATPHTKCNKIAERCGTGNAIESV